jgi:hypothetical protein
VLEKIKLDRSKINKILPFLLCILIAFLVWIYVMYVNEPEYVHEYDGISVSTRDVPTRFRDCEIIIDDTVSASFRGTNVDLAKCENGGINGYVSLTRFSEPGIYETEVAFEYPVGVALTPIEAVKVRIEIIEPKNYTKYFNHIPVEVVDTENGSRFFNEYNITVRDSVVSAAITTKDEAIFNWLQDNGVKAIADISSIEISGVGEYLIALKFVGDNGEVFDDVVSYTYVLVSAKDSKTD